MHDPAAAEFPSQLSFRYRYEKLLGEGSNGKTFLATSLITGQPVAIKALKLNQNDSFKSFELFKREAETLSSNDCLNSRWYSNRALRAVSTGFAIS